MPGPNETVEQINECIEFIDELDEEIKDKAPEFFESVRGKLAGISETIERTLLVTKNQQRAIDNMMSSVYKWRRDDD